MWILVSTGSTLTACSIWREPSWDSAASWHVSCLLPFDTVSIDQGAALCPQSMRTWLTGRMGRSTRAMRITSMR